MAIVEVNRPKKFKAVIRINGRQFSKSFRRKVDAIEWERKILVHRDEGRVFLPSLESPTLLNELRERFVSEYARHSQSASTLNMEGSLYRKYIKPFLGSCRIDQIRSLDVRSLMSKLTGDLALSNGQANRVRQVLGSLFSRAVEWELVQVNPVASVRKYPEKDYSHEKVQFLSQGESRQLLDWLELNDPWLYPKVRVLMNTGIRYGEMCALSVADVLAGPNGFSLSVSKTFCRSLKTIKEETKGGRSRHVPLGSGMTEWLKEQVLPGKAASESLLFGSASEFRHHTRFRKRFKKALKGAGVREIRVHDLRHTYAVQFLEKGGQMYDLQKVLGHQSQRLTERYSHFSAAMRERARGLVDHGSRPRLSLISGGNPEAMLPSRCTSDVQENESSPSSGSMGQ